LCKASTQVEKLVRPTTGRLDAHVDRAKRDLVSAMALDVVYSPRFVYEKRKWANSCLSKKEYFQLSPVWKTAPSTAYKRANRLSSLLRFVAVFGWRVPSKPLVRKLLRLSMYAWTMSTKDFNGLCRSISCSVQDSIRNQKDPDALVLLGELTSLPYFTVEKFRQPSGNRRSKFVFKLQNLPGNAFVSLQILNSMKSSRRSRVAAKLQLVSG